MRKGFFLWVLMLLPLAAMSEERGKRMVVLGVDGMDPVLLRQYMEENVMPHFSRLAQAGGLRSLGTSIPPQSPVAWSNFITGMGPGSHGIFDFVGFNRKSLLPYLSVARVEKPKWGPIGIGRWRIPLGSERTVGLRDGEAFWERLEAAGVSTTLFRIPANYPPAETSGKALSGMGTPDLRGTPGLFTFYTNDPAIPAGDLAGGSVVPVSVENGVVRTALKGPPNRFLADSPSIRLPFEVDLDVENPVARIRIGDHAILLNQGEWSRWLPVRFSMLKGVAEVPGMVRFYLKQTAPYFQLYASPVNIDPADPALPISTPPEYAPELAAAAGRFYTQEMPEDTKALSARVLTPREFLAQSGLVMNERRRLLEHALKRFNEEQADGLLFFYISSVDQRHHMLYRQADPAHPNHSPKTPPDLADAMRTVYREIDELVGMLLAKLDAGTALVVMSDHGFAPFYREANLNRWLEEQGYLTFAYSDEERETLGWLQGIDWSETLAFAVGLNSLYLNVEGREREGIVAPEEREALAREIVAGLKQWRDPKSGAFVVTQPLLREEIYHGPHLAKAPDIVVGYARGYRASWATTSGHVPRSLIDDNLGEWSGDHCIDSREVPGILVSSLALREEEGELRDLTVSILRYFGVVPSGNMRGRMLFK